MKKYLLFLFLLSCNDFQPSIDRAIEKRVEPKCIYTNGITIVIDNADFMVKIKSTSSWLNIEQWYYTDGDTYNNVRIGYPLNIEQFIKIDTNNEIINNS